MPSQIWKVGSSHSQAKQPQLPGLGLACYPAASLHDIARLYRDSKEKCGCTGDSFSLPGPIQATFVLCCYIEEVQLLVQERGL